MTIKECEQFAKDWLTNDVAEFQTWPTQMEMARFMQSVQWHLECLNEYKQIEREGYDNY